MRALNKRFVAPSHRVMSTTIREVPSARILRALDSLQVTANHQVSTPLTWEPGDDVIISGQRSRRPSPEKYPHGWKAPRPYLAIVPEPTEKTHQEGAA